MDDPDNKIKKPVVGANNSFDIIEADGNRLAYILFKLDVPSSVEQAKRDQILAELNAHDRLVEIAKQHKTDCETMKLDVQAEFDERRVCKNSDVELWLTTYKPKMAELTDMIEEIDTILKGLAPE